MADDNFSNDSMKKALEGRMKRVIIIDDNQDPSKMDPVGEEEVDNRELMRKRIKLGERAADAYNKGTLQKHPKEERDQMEDDAKRMMDQMKMQKPNRFNKGGQPKGW